MKLGGVEVVLGLLLAMMGNASFALDVTIVSGQTCPSGSRLMTYQEALAEQNKVCNSLGQWYIGRLAENSSIDGPGYQCKIRQADARALTNAVCVAAPVPPAWSVSAIHNNSGHEISVYVPVRSGETLAANNALGAGRIALASDLGVVKFSEARQVTAPCGAFWRVSVISSNQSWSYYLRQAGTIDVTINQDNGLTMITPIHRRPGCFRRRRPELLKEMS